MSCPCSKPLVTSSKSWLGLHSPLLLSPSFLHSLITSHFASCTLCFRPSGLLPSPWLCPALSQIRLFAYAVPSAQTVHHQLTHHFLGKPSWVGPQAYTIPALTMHSLACLVHWSIIPRDQHTTAEGMTEPCGTWAQENSPGSEQKVMHVSSSCHLMVQDSGCWTESGVQRALTETHSVAPSPLLWTFISPSTKEDT